MTAPIRFDDGAAYERGMGQWSQLVGNTFLHCLTPDQRVSLKRCVHGRLSSDADGRVSYSASANAIAGLVPA